MTWQKNAVKLS